MMTHLLMMRRIPRVAGRQASRPRRHFLRLPVEAVIVASAAASAHLKPRSNGEGMGRTWNAPWSSASATAMLTADAQMIHMENRIVLARFKDATAVAPVSVLKALATNRQRRAFEASMLMK